MTGSLWSAQEDLKLLRLLRRGLSFRAISAELERPVQGCKGRWNKLRVRKPRSAPPKLAAAVVARSRKRRSRGADGRYVTGAQV